MPLSSPTCISATPVAQRAWIAPVTWYLPSPTPPITSSVPVGKTRKIPPPDTPDVYRAEDFAPIAERGRLELLDGDTELFTGLNLLVTDGHCPGHQMVVFSHGGERIVYTGDLVPTPHHLGLTVISSYDYEPESTLNQKRDILNQAEQQGWLLVFPHGHETRAGYLERRQDMSYLRPVEF